MTVVISVMNSIARVLLIITSAVHLVSAFLPVSAVTATLIVQMQAMKWIMKVSIVRLLKMISPNQAATSHY